MGKRQKAAAAVLGTLAAAGLVTGAAIDSPAQLAEEDPIIVIEEEFEQVDDTLKGIFFRNAKRYVYV